MARRAPPRRRGRGGGRRPPRAQPERLVAGPPAGGPVTLPASMTVAELAELLGRSGIEVIKQLMRQGVLANLTQVLEYGAAAVVAGELGFQPQEAPGEEASELQAPTAPVVGEEEGGVLEPRPPVVTILGHVDHGKTTLLDGIRQSRVAAGEVGGITQHIGAYQVAVPGGRITFLDTPGHEAFTAMRARGVRATDIAVLVVAADDGVMPQTVEAIAHARVAEVPIIVAINKVDRPDADVERVKRQLLEQGLVMEELGGQVIAVPVSAQTGEGVAGLLENILLVAEVAELRADPERLAAGVVIEARVDRARGPLATILVQQGTLRVGQPIVAGAVWGRVKAMRNDLGKQELAAGPSQPVEVLGLESLAQAGDPVVAFAEDRLARAYVEARQREQARVPLRRAFPVEEGGQGKVLRLILKADVQGSVEPVRTSLERLSTPESRLLLLHAGAGSINESDILLAVASGAMVVGFNSQPEAGARSLAQDQGVPIRTYAVIYQLLDEIREVLEGAREPVLTWVVEGHAEVRAVFTAGRRQKIAGLYVTDGRIGRGASARILRGGTLLCEGTISSLKRVKDYVREVAAGLECGAVIDGCADFATGDTIEASRQAPAPRP